MTTFALPTTAPAHITIIAVHAWRFENGDQTYSDPDCGDPVDGWNVHTEHRDPDGDDLTDWAGAVWKDEDFTTETEARAAAERWLAEGVGTEIREY